MKTGIIVLVLTLTMEGAIHAQESMDKLKWIDLTYPFTEKTLYWPNNPKGFELDTLHDGPTEKGFYYSSFGFCAPEHGGTHLDAPIHFAQGKKTVDQLDVNQLTGNAVVIDVSSKAMGNRDYLISVDDILAWEKTNGALDPNTIVLFRTGGIQSLTFSRSKVKAVGIDTASIDYGQSSDFKAHRILLRDDIPVFENVANLDKLPAKGIYVVALPMLIEKGSGGPLRIIAGLKG